MATKGQILENPTTGDIYEFLETAKDTNGERMSLKFTLKSKGKLVPDHFHVLQDEHFEVLSGKLTVKKEGKTQTISAGEQITLEKNKPHNHYNTHDEPLVMIQTVTPALDLEYMLENLIGMAKDGTMKNGKSSMVQQLVTLKYLDSTSYLADVPIGIQKLMMNVVGPIARQFGYRAVYKKYCGIEK